MLLILAVLLLLPGIVHAEETDTVTVGATAPDSKASDGSGKVVRVGWYESKFHQTDAYGRKSGYGYEYQRKVAAYTGWTYEYVEGSWPELFEKLKKGEMEPLVRLVRNPDVLKAAKCPRKVGFAAETGDPVAEAARKCREKGLAFIVANDVTAPGAGFGVDTNKVAFVFPDGHVERLSLMTKRTLARRIVAELAPAHCRHG